MPELHTAGAEFQTKLVWTEEVTKPSSLSVGLYNDSSDGLSAGSTLSDITTEPDTGQEYSRQSVSFGTTDMTAQATGNDWEVVITDGGNPLVYQVDSNTQTVDSYFVVVNFTGSNSGDQLFFTGELEASRDLSQIDRLEVEEVGRIIT